MNNNEDFDFNALDPYEQLEMLNYDKYGKKKEYKEHVYLDMSHILNRNGESIRFGAFANKDHNDGAIICIYDGDIIDLDQIKEHNIDTTYGVNITNTNYCINSTSPYSCFARYINDGMSEEINNCAWQKVGKYTMKIKAIRDISAGEELLISYGNYWAEFDRFELLSDENRLLIYNDDVHEMKDWIDQNYILRDGKFHRIYFVDD